ncbi:MAG: TatD family hydrolase [Myxococcaceae bacterium]
MPSSDPKLFDVHLHAEGLTDQDLESLHFFGVQRAIVPAHATFAEPSAKRLLDQFGNLVDKQLARLSKAGIRAHAALGIHPRAIPRRGVPEILSALPSYFRQGKVVALGPVGLFEDTEVEREVMTEQLLLARRLKVKVLVTTPAKNREAVTRRTLQLLLGSGVPPSRVLVDGAISTTLAPIRACGFHAALMLHPDGLTADAAVALIRRSGVERLCLSSHAGDGASDIVGLARAQSLMLRAKLTESLIRRVTLKNAERFFSA